MNNTKNTLRVAAGLLGLALAGGAHAGHKYHTCGGSGGGSDPTCTGETWTFQSSSTTTQNSFSTQSTPTGVAATATGFHQDSLTPLVSGGPAETYTQRQLTIYQPDNMALNYNNVTSSGTAITNGDPTNIGAGKESSPNHAFDNSSGYDLVIFQFDKAVTLSQIKMGWLGSDSDFSLFVWTPSTDGQAPPGSDGFSIASMASQANSAAEDGWTLIGSFDYDQYASTSTALNIETLTSGTASSNNSLRKEVTDYASSYWAIGAVVDSIAQYGAKYGSSVKEKSSGSYTETNDYFKIAQLSGCYDNPPPGPPGVPEPMSMALVALGLVGGLKMKRKARAQA
ncbi:MAG: PEP-CTERM sorting domain-containing protein [Gammaproteobacteria bacterium]